MLFHVHTCTTSSDFRLFSSVELSSIFISFRFFGHQDQINLFKEHAYFMWAVYDIYVISDGNLCWIWQSNGKRNSEKYLLLKLHYFLCKFVDPLQRWNSLDSERKMQFSYKDAVQHIFNFSSYILNIFELNFIKLKAKAKYDPTANASGFHLFCYVILSSSSSKCSTVANECAIRRIKPKMCYFSFKW